MINACNCRPASDWIAYVRQKLGSTGLAPECEQEIVAELAGHLEDRYAATGDAENAECDWAALARKIRSLKGDYMHARLRNFWIPGLITGVISTIALRLVQAAGYRPIVGFTQHHHIEIVIYIPWLLMLPLAGAVGAYWSRQAGGDTRTRLLVAIFPCLALAAPVGVMMLGTTGAAFFYPGTVERLDFLALAFPVFLGVWIVAPGLALALGALPFLSSRQRTEPLRSDAATA